MLVDLHNDTEHALTAALVTAEAAVAALTVRCERLEAALWSVTWHEAHHRGSWTFCTRDVCQAHRARGVSEEGRE